MTSVDDINSLESEAGIIASLIHKPDFIFYSEYLLPNHFTNKENRCVYTAIGDLVSRGITTVDPYNIIESLNASHTLKQQILATMWKQLYLLSSISTTTLCMQSLIQNLTSARNVDMMEKSRL